MFAKKWFKVFVGVVVACVAARWLFFPPKSESTIDLPTAEVEYLDSFVDQTTCLGRPKPESERYVSVQKGGRLEILGVKVGDTVVAGQIVGIVDKTVNASTLKSALSSFRLAQKDYGRMSGLARSGSASRDEVDKSQSNLEVKRAELEKAKQGVEDGILRAAFPGRVSVIVFKVGDKIPDGSRVVAIEAPGVLQLACRVPSRSAAQLPKDETKPLAVTWQNLDQPDSKPVKAPATVSVVEAGEFVGIDREIRLTTDAANVLSFARHRVQATMPLNKQNNVAKVPSDALIKRTGGFFTLIKAKDESVSWNKVGIVRRDATTAYVTGIPKDSTVLRIVKDISQYEAQIGKSPDSKADKG